MWSARSRPCCHRREGAHTHTHTQRGASPSQTHGHTHSSKKRAQSKRTKPAQYWSLAGFAPAKERRLVPAGIVSQTRAYVCPPAYEEAAFRLFASRNCQRAHSYVRPSYHGALFSCVASTAGHVAQTQYIRTLIFVETKSTLSHAYTPSVRRSAA